MNRHQYGEYRALLDSGVKVDKNNVGVRYNAGGESETYLHSTVKNLVSHVALLNGYKVDSEVEVVKYEGTTGEIDVLIWGHPERLSYAVEVETSPTEDTLSEKQSLYIDGTAVDDIQILNVNDCPEKILPATKWVADELGLEP
jgi:hypothetical protein